MEASLKYSTILSEGIFTCSEQYLNDHVQNVCFVKPVTACRTRCMCSVLSKCYKTLCAWRHSFVPLTAIISGATVCPLTVDAPSAKLRLAFVKNLFENWTQSAIKPLLFWNSLFEFNKYCLENSRYSLIR